MKRWTADECAELRRVYAEAGKEPVDLLATAARMGRTVFSIALKANELGITRKDRHKIVGGAKPKPPMFASAEELSAHKSRLLRERIAKNGHPRGALGLKHTPEAKQKMASAIRRAWDDPTSNLRSDALAQRRSDAAVARTVARRNPRGFLRSQSAAYRREDLGGLYVRSSWEANYARYLNYLIERKQIASWEYETKVFVFERISRGTRTYTPDFKVIALDGRHEWHEVKGWMDQKSRTRLDRMARYFPDEVVIVIDEAWFKRARASGLASMIPNWEIKKQKRKAA